MTLVKKLRKIVDGKFGINWLKDISDAADLIENQEIEIEAQSTMIILAGKMHRRDQQRIKELEEELAGSDIKKTMSTIKFTTKGGKLKTTHK